MSNVYTRGALVRVRFAFPTRALTDAEKATYASGGDLPVGTGTDPTTVKFDQKAPGASVWTTYTYPTVIQKEKTGQYFVDLDTTTATATEDYWRYLGYATGTGQAAVKDKFFLENEHG